MDLRLPLARLPNYFWVALLLLGLLLGLHWVSRPAMVPGAVNLTQAVWTHPQQPDIPARVVALPHILDDEPRGLQDRASYRIEVSAGLASVLAGSEHLALLLPRVGTRFRVLLNGHEVFDVGWHAPAQRTINAAWEPYLVQLPTALLRPPLSSNHFDIEVQGQLLERSGLWPLQIGPREQLQSRLRTLEFWQVTSTWMMTVTAVLMGFMALFLWLFMRERLFALMALAFFTHAVRLVLSVVVEPPMSFEAYFLLHRISFTWYCAFLYLFMEDLFGYRLRLARLLDYGLLLVGPVWMVVTLIRQDYDLYRIWAGVLATVAAVNIGLVLYRSGWMRRMSDDQVLVMVVALFTFVTGLRDFVVIQLGWPGDGDLRWMAPGSMALMIAFGWVLLQRSLASTREVRRLNTGLARTVSERERELRQAFDQLRASERERAVETERRRLMRDMHDGLGSHLVQTLNMVRNGRDRLDSDNLATMLGHALDELRIMLDSLEPMDGDLPTILGTLRLRIEPALTAAGIDLDWQVEDVPAIPSLDAPGVMHLFRCLQEVFANVAKHAQARHVKVSTWSRDGVVHLVVQDDGRGMAMVGNEPALRLGGRGLRNLRVRSALIGARVRFFDAAPGLGVEFIFDGQPPSGARVTAPAPL